MVFRSQTPCYFLSYCVGAKVSPQNKCLALFLVLHVTYYWCLSAVNQCAVRLKTPIMCDYMNNQLIPCSSTATFSSEHCVKFCSKKNCRNPHFQVAVVSEVQLGSAYCKLVHLCEIKITTKYFDEFLLSSVGGVSIMACIKEGEPLSS